jgi:hypothetical protein
LPRATSLAARIKQTTGVDADLIKGGGGIFDVHCFKEQGERLVFSKHETGRFPEEDEVLGLLEQA